MFRTFFVLRQNGSLSVVDCFSSRRHPTARMYINVTPASMSRLRVLWRKDKRSVTVIRGKFSKARVDAVKSIALDRGRVVACVSLDYLQTSGPHA